MLAVAVFVAHAASLVKTNFDSRWTIPTALYAEMFAKPGEAVLQARGHFYSAFPLGPALVAVPFLAAFEGAFVGPERSPVPPLQTLASHPGGSGAPGLRRGWLTPARSEKRGCSAAEGFRR